LTNARSAEYRPAAYLAVELAGELGRTDHFQPGQALNKPPAIFERLGLSPITGQVLPEAVEAHP